MELGATICVPKAPRCRLCPVEKLCEAKRLGQQNRLPLRSPRRARPHQEVAVALIWKDGKLLIAQRPLEGLLGGLWEFPGGKRQPHESLEKCLHREIREELGIDIDVNKKLATVRHKYSHLRVTLHAFECRWQKGMPKAIGCQNWAWVSVDQLKKYAFPRGSHKIIQQFLARNTLNTKSR